MGKWSGRRGYLIAGFVTAALGVAWRFWLSVPFTIRVPRDFNVVTTYFGTQTNADPGTGLIPDRDELGTYERRLRVIDAHDWPQSVVLADDYRVRDLRTGEILFEYLTRERVDPRTGASYAGPHKGEIVLFPRNVGKLGYVMRANYVKSIPLAFTGVDEIDGLETYVFSYRGHGEYTQAFGGNEEFPGVAVKPGQEIHCADDQFYYRIWVEPTTGEQVRIEEGCPSNDYIYETATNRKLAAVDRWSGATSAADVARKVPAIYRRRRLYLLASRYIPATLFAASLLLLARGLIPRKVKASG